MGLPRGLVPLRSNSRSLFLFKIFDVEAVPRSVFSKLFIDKSYVPARFSDVTDILLAKFRVPTESVLACSI